MNNQQRQMQLLSYQLGLNKLSEALESAEKAQDNERIAEVTLKLEKLIEKNEHFTNEEKIWLH